jgi:cephalosporin-C deacetylase-like acetyl esterase
MSARSAVAASAVIRRGSSIVAVAAGALALGCGSTGAQTGDLFAYDARAPLDVREASSTVADGVRTIELSYASPKGGRVPATLILPAAGGPAPAAIFQHGAGDASRGDFRAEAQDLARSGLASLLVDAPLARPGHRSWITFQLRDRAAYVQNVVDIRRGLDLLEGRAEVDANRIALVGHSYGGSIVGVVAGLEQRAAAVVVMAGPGRMTDFLRQQGQAWVRRARAGKPRTNRRKQLTRYLAYMRAVDAAEHVGRATAPIFFQFGRRDELPARWFQTYVDAAGPAKRVEWYDAGHLLCECATRDRKAWLLERLAGSAATVHAR